MMNNTIDIQVAVEGCDLPEVAFIEKIVTTILPEGQQLSIRIVDEEEMRALNHQFSNKDKSTNVLAFPADFPEEVGIPLLGDIAACAPVIAREAREQGKTLEAHWAHMLLHSCLHLLGYDHQTPEQADAMESKEIGLLKDLGYSNPYEADR